MRTGCGALLALVLLGGPLHGADPLLLHPHYQAGDLLSIEVVRTLELQGDIPLEPGQATSLTVTTRRHVRYRDHIQQVEEGQPIQLERIWWAYRDQVVQDFAAYEGDEHPEVTEWGGTRQRVFLTAGQPPRTITPAPELAELEPEDLRLASPFDALLPTEPVQPGDVWEPAPEALARFLEGSEDYERASVQAAFHGVEEVLGRQVARVTLTWSFRTPEVNFAPITDATYTGYLLFDLAHRKIVEVRLTGQVSIDDGRTRLSGTSSIRRRVLVVE